MAATLKEAVWPVATVWLVGCAVIEGAAAAAAPTENAALSISFPPLESVTDWVMVCVPLATLLVPQGYAVPPLAVPVKS